MQLLVLVLNKVESMPAILSDFMTAGIGGATVVDCRGMLRVMNSDSIEPPPIFGSLRMLINPEREHGKMLFVVLSDDQVETAKEIIREKTGGLNTPDSGIMFTVALSSVEGVKR